MQSDSNILQIENLSKYFGGLAAVSRMFFKIKKGSITGIIGPNGSGKTTLFNLIAGNLKTSKGTVFLIMKILLMFLLMNYFQKVCLELFKLLMNLQI